MVTLVADRWLKTLALSGHVGRLGLTKFILFKNPGIIFSWPVPNAAAIVLMCLAIAGVVWWGWRSWKRKNYHSLMAGSLIGLGAISNLYDRMAHGFVIDWAYVGPWWPVMNLADMMIMAGIVIALRPAKIDKQPAV